MNTDQSGGIQTAHPLESHRLRFGSVPHLWTSEHQQIHSQIGVRIY